MRSFIVPMVVLALVVTLAGCEFIGGADTVVTGHNNMVAVDGVVDRVAVALAGFEATPEVTDEVLQALYAQIREQALAGDMDATLVVLKVAALQRMPEDSDESEEPED